MFEVSNLKLKELTKIAQVSVPSLSRKFKSITNDSLIERRNNRITGISPALTEEYLKEVGVTSFYKGSVIMSGNLCGGCSKTSGTLNLGACMRRLTDKPIIYIDCDSQGSLTQQICDTPANDNEAILIDYLEEKASLKDILTEVKGSQNTYIIKSNLNNAYLDKVLSKPIDIKKLILKLFEDLFDTFGDEAKIFIDFPPQLSNIFTSSITGLSLLKKDILKVLLIPLRSDSFSINGGSHIVKEFTEVMEVFSLENNIDIHCYFSSVDRRIKATGDAMKLAISSEELAKHLSPVAIRYSSEVIKATMSNSTIFKEGKGTAPADYQDLIDYIYGYEKSDKVLQ